MVVIPGEVKVGAGRLSEMLTWRWAQESTALA